MHFLPLRVAFAAATSITSAAAARITAAHAAVSATHASASCSLRTSSVLHFLARIVALTGVELPGAKNVRARRRQGSLLLRLFCGRRSWLGCCRRDGPGGCLRTKRTGTNQAKRGERK